MPASVPVDLRQLYKCGWSVAVGSADKRRFCCCCQETCCKAAQLWTAEAINSSVCLSHRQHPPHYPCDNSSTEQNITASWHTVPHFKESKPYQFISAEFSHTDSLREKQNKSRWTALFDTINDQNKTFSKNGASSQGYTTITVCPMNQQPLSQLRFNCSSSNILIFNT